MRSGWARTSALAPIVWAGDQRTSFDRDDGFPTVLAMGIGMGASGVSLFTHDIGGYQSVGNPPSTRELWFRWASLGAFTPIMRTHHGAFDTDNWQFDSDDATTEHFAAMAIHEEPIIILDSSASCEKYLNKQHDENKLLLLLPSHTGSLQRCLP